MKTTQRPSSWPACRGAGATLRKNRHGGYGLQVLVAVLMLLMAGVTPAWAEKVHFTWDTDSIKDDGGGMYRFRGEGNDVIDIGERKWKPENNGYFKTQQHFDADKNQFWWNFEVRVDYFGDYWNNGAPVDIYGQKYTGVIYVVTADDVPHQIATWSKATAENRSTPYTNTNEKWGTVHVSDVQNPNTIGHGYVTIDYTPSDKAIEDGVKRIVMRQDIVAYSPGISLITLTGWVQYEKALTFSGIAADKPMPTLTVEWNDNGQLSAKATGVPDKRKDDQWQDQRYTVKTFYYTGTGQSYERTFGTKNKAADCADGNNGKMDMSFSFLPPALADRVYTVPTYIKYSGGMTVNPASPTIKKFIDLIQPEAGVVEIQPFTRPIKVWVEHDQWKKKNVIQWDRQKKEAGHNGSRQTSVECRTDGKWYVIRYIKNGSATDYTLVNTLNGNATTLEMTDDKIDYDKSYVYRVIFLPSLLESKYKDRLASLPGSQSAGDYNLWKEAEISTNFTAQVKLSHDKTYDDGVRLVWEYDIQATGLEWSIDYRGADSEDGTWLTKPETIPIDPKKTTAEVVYDGSVCERIDYRIRTTVNGREVCSNILSANLPAGSYISQVKATTGTEESTVVVKWKVVRPDKSHDIYYRVRRRIVGEDNTMWVTLTDEIHGTASDYEYIDTRPLAGTYYEYCVEAFGALCDEQTRQSDSEVAPGFSQARGTITGHISFGSGTAVQGVRVDLVKTSSDDETSAAQYLSRAISGDGQGLHWTADSARYVHTLNGSSPLTLQLWAKPKSTATGGQDLHQLLSLAGTLELGVKSGSDGSYHLYAIDRSQGGTTRKEFPRLVFDPLDFTHITAVYDKMKWKFYVGSDSLLTDSMTVAAQGWNAVAASHGANAATPTLSFGGDNRVSGSNAYDGYVDDVRLWLRALTRQEIEGNYTRILGGTEKGLTLYWPLDEGEAVNKYAFDIARQDGIYQENHPVVGANVNPKTETPSLLKLYGVTDSEGDYIIRGIPFQQGGTNYKIVPMMGVHEFSPGTRSMFVSPTSLTANNIDFEDVSSFPMQGHIYYAGTNIPAEGILLKVDGMTQSVDGKLVQTDAEGRYEVSVPIGEHFVEAYLDDHTMVDGGRYPTSGKIHFDRPVQHDFIDSTLVNLVGRIGGGERNDTLAVGFGASKNNIGMATITLKINNESKSFNCQDDRHTTATTYRTWQSDTTSINSRAWTGCDNNFKENYIYIRTDSLTGEFSAKIPPLKYTVKSIVVDSNKDKIQFTELPELDLSVAKELGKDSLRVPVDGGNDSIWVRYGYHTKMVRTYYAQPQMDVVEKDHPKGVYGLKEITYPAQEQGGTDIVIGNLYKEDSDTLYLVGYPIYKMGQTVKYHLRGYEAYENRDAATVVCDTIGLNHQNITITNEMSSEQRVVYKVMDESTGYKEGQVYDVQQQQIPLDDNGEAELTWMAGPPNITAPYTRKFNVLMEHKDRTYNVANIDAVVLGQLTNGNNFVTQGPDVVDFVLRDPQGANSTTKLTTGTSVTKTFYDTRKAYGEYKFIAGFGFGASVQEGTGVGLMIISSFQANKEIDAGFHSTWEKTWNRDSTHVVTTTKNVATSGSTPYVGAPGDVYIGKSTNFLIGGCRHLFIGRNIETKKYEVKLENAISIGDTISTAFKFTQYELETVMIPKWKDTRRSFLTEVATAEEARNYVNHGSSSVYLTWLGLDLDDYSEGINYVWAKPESWKTAGPPNGMAVDSVAWCNNQIISWQNAIADNEADKLRLMNEGKKTNISIDGGSSYNYSKRTSDTKHDETKVDWKLGAVLNFTIGVQTEHIAAHNVLISAESEDGGGQTTGDGTITENFTEWEYNIEDGNRDTDLSLTIYESDNSKYSDFFSVFGGQTYNPYQPQEVTHYYKPGTPLGNSTEQMEQPDLRIGLPGENTAKSVTVNDIPAGGEANVVLQCTNLGNAHQGIMFSYGLEVLDETNTNGLQILMDGVPINGRSLYLEHGESVTKVLTIRQSDQSILDYEGIKLWFESQYQPNLIHSEVTLNAHFVPSSSPVMLAIDEPVVNSGTPGAKLQMTLKGFNRQFLHLKEIGVQYRFQGNTQWTNLRKWFVNAADTVGTGMKLVPESGDIHYELDMMSNLAYPEGNYELRAYTTTPYGTDMVHVYSDIVAVTKDRTLPINLYTPAPANGILGYGEQLAIEFNEDIVPGYVGDENVIVTAKLNSSEVHHDVAYRLLPYEEMMPRTTNPVFLTSSFAMDFWLNWHEAGTILHLGEKIDNFALSIGDDGYVTVTMGNNTYRSDAAVPKDSWTFFALNYDTEKKKFNMLALQGTDNIYLFSDKEVSMENVQAVHYLSDNRLYLGPVEADIHSLGLYNYCRDLSLASDDKYNAKDGYVYGLANFWPMDEGHGTVAADLRHTHDFEVEDLWKLENVNYGLRINKPEGIMADISRIGTGPGESYAIEMWFNKSGNPKGETVFETATPDPYSPMTNQNEVTNLHLRFDSLQNLVLDYGRKSQVVASHEAFPDLRRYHHYALNVVRGQAASFYLDGQRTAVIPEADVPPIEGSRLIVGRNNEILAYADEIRIWHAALSESRLLSNMYNTLDTADVYSRGLVAYYPFEKTGEEDGVVTKVSTLENMAPNAAAKALDYDVKELFQHTPPLKNAPDETKLTATPVASDRKVVINLSMVGLTARQLEGTTLNITVDKIRDLHGNASQPIRWTAYVQQNTLKWTKDSVNVNKKYGEDYTFDVDIENKSGSTEYYTLYNMPQWLSLVDSERSDDVSPLKTKTLRFRVNPLTPVGNYDATIGLQGNNGIQEPMRIVMKVRGEKPQWSVDPTKYEHQMSIIGQVYINGILMENAESMVAAFIGDECRGVASPEKVRGAAYVTMNVYGNDTKAKDRGKALTFRIWDATQGVAYTDAQIAVDGSPIDIVFGQDKLIGNFDHPAIWTKSENVEQLIPVHLNWNWIAFGVVPKSPYLDHIFADYADWQLLIKNRTLFSDYNGAEWNGTLQPVANAMYKLRIDRLPTTKKEAPNSLLAVSGRQLKEDAERAVTLSKGWNWIAYTPLTTMTVDEALAAANPQTGDIVKSQTAVAIYGPYGWEGSLKALEGGHGYLYFTNDSIGKSFLYPAASSASAKARMAAPRRAAEEDELRIFHPVELGLYPSNMTMVIRLLAADGSPVDTCEVGAFIGDECRGAARASSRGLYYLVISGEGAGQPMTLRSCIDGEIIDIDNSLMYVSEDNIGTSWDPYVIDLSRFFTGIIAVDGSPTDDDSDWYTLQGFKIGRKPTQPGVYIHRGEKVVVKRKK